MLAPVRSTLRRAVVQQQHRFASTVPAVSNAALTQLETRWSKLPEAEQGAIADYLAEAQKGDWKAMTLEQKRAAYYIAYGSYGARTPSDPVLRTKVASWIAGISVVSLALWTYWEKTKIQPSTMTKEWREATEKWSIENKLNPHLGPYAEVRAKNPDA
ncbi:cytochrome c oxidase subunit IV-domain-containing protein [Entophlyctis helioformis]|nr:cytochrome c oxidase subunit IV-domain-containing protein [Entophlyctis helioformis]